jgi:hypothetical protein
MNNPQDPVEAFMKSIDAVWNSAYGHWSLKTEVQKPALHLDPKEAAFFYREAKRMELKANIKELAHWAEFFKDSSMNALTPSERLEKRTAELEAQLQRIATPNEPY